MVRHVRNDREIAAQRPIFASVCAHGSRDGDGEAPRNQARLMSALKHA
jgi:hypothetical protein